MKISLNTLFHIIDARGEGGNILQINVLNRCLVIRKNVVQKMEYQPLWKCSLHIWNVLCKSLHNILFIV